MADDELSAPLGQNAKKKQRASSCRSRIPQVDRGRARPVRLRLFAGWALVVDDPLGGEPVAVVATGLGPPSADARRGVGDADARPRSYDGPGDAGAAPVRDPCRRTAASRRRRRRPARKTVTIIDGAPASARRSRSRRRAGRRAPVEQRLLETLAARRDPADRAGRRAAGRGLCPRRRSRCRASTGRPAHRHRDRRARRQRQRHRAGASTKLPGAGDASRSRLMAPTSSALVDARPRRRPRGAAAGADGAVRLSGQRSRPADAADVARPPSRTSTACTG